MPAAWSGGSFSYRCNLARSLEAHRGLEGLELCSGSIPPSRLSGSDSAVIIKPKLFLSLELFRTKIPMKNSVFRSLAIALPGVLSSAPNAKGAPVIAL